MRPLLCKAIVRILILYLYGLFIAWIFTTIKKLDETAHQRMERMLTNLRNEVGLKYNVTDNEFNSFVKIAAEAMKAKEELECNFFNICNSVVATLTTIAKPHLTHGIYFSLSAFFSKERNTKLLQGPSTMKVSKRELKCD